MISLLELMILVVAFVFFLRSLIGMGLFILHLCHVPRAIVGFVISEKLPKVHQIIDMFKPDDLATSGKQYFTIDEFQKHF